MTASPTSIKAIENVLRRRGIDLYDQELRGFMDLGGAVDEHLWQEIVEERELLELDQQVRHLVGRELPITMFEPKPWWRFWQ